MCQLALPICAMSMRANGQPVVEAIIQSTLVSASGACLEVTNARQNQVVILTLYARQNLSVVILRSQKLFEFQQHISVDSKCLSDAW